MAQRAHNCPQCARPLEVPDDYFRAHIRCPWCHATMDRRSGELVSAGPQQPQAAPPQHQPPTFLQPQYQPQYPAPQQYPAHHQHPLQYPAPQYAPQVPQKKGFPRWAIGLIAGGVICVVAFGAAVVWATGKMKEAGERVRESRSTPPTSKWVKYEDPDGQFSALFPREPRFRTVQAENGLWINEATCTTLDGRWEVAYFDLSSHHTFDENGGLSGFAKEAGGVVTESRPAAHQGYTGLYGEIDEGRHKVQVLRVRQTVWVVSAAEYRDDFPFFLENFRLSDKALGVQPLAFTVTPRQELYEGLAIPSGRVYFRASGGRPPYEFTLDNTLPPGLQRKVDDGSESFHYLLQGTPTTAGNYTIDMTVTDADGRTERIATPLEVKELPADACFVTPTVGSRVGRNKFTHLKKGEDIWTLSWEVGHDLAISFEARSLLGGYTASTERGTILDPTPPEWMELRSGDFPLVSGIPDSAGTADVNIEVVVTLDGSDREFAVPLKLRIEVAPLPEELIPPRDGTGVQEGRLEYPVGIATTGFVRGVPQKPSRWHWGREWHVDVEWSYDESELPPGMTFDERPATDRDPTSLWLRGTPEQAGVFEATITCHATVKFISEPFETIHKLTFEITPVPDSEIPNELAQDQDVFEVGASVGRRFGVLVPFKIDRPRSWKYRRAWELEASWLTEEVDLPPGLELSTKSIDRNQPPRLYLQGAPEEAGVWEIEIKATVRIKYIERTFEVTRTVKLTVN